MPIPKLGQTDDLERLVAERGISLVVIAMERNDQAEAEKMVQRLSEQDVEIKIIPDILIFFRVLSKPVIFSVRC
jgi:FlaA1/EpsC-like NDP-sugar epimerase